MNSSKDEILKNVAIENHDFFRKFFLESDDEEFLGFPDVENRKISCFNDQGKNNMITPKNTLNNLFLDSDDDDILSFSNPKNYEFYRTFFLESDDEEEFLDFPDVDNRKVLSNVEYEGKDNRAISNNNLNQIPLESDDDDILSFSNPKNYEFFKTFFSESDNEQFSSFQGVKNKKTTSGLKHKGKNNIATSKITLDKLFVDSDGDENFLSLSDPNVQNEYYSDTDENSYSTLLPTEQQYVENWSKVTKVQETSDLPKKLSFTANPGQSTKSAKAPLDFFKLFITDEMFEDLAKQTNIYCQYLLDKHKINLKNIPPNIIKFREKPTTAEEIKTFLALILTTGLVCKQYQSFTWYWSTDLVVQTPFFSRIMSRDRFTVLLWCLHLSDNNIQRPKKGEPGYNPLAKLGQLYPNIIQRFKAAYIPNRNICIDETIVGYKGRIYFRTHNPQKPEKLGIRLYVLYDSNTSYTWNVIVHTGKETVKSGNNGIDHAHVVVLKLMDSLLNQGYHVHMDRWFSSPALFQALYEKETYATGVVMLNRRWLPKVELQEKTKRGDIISFRNGPLLLIKSHSQKKVAMLSTFHNGEMSSFEHQKKTKKKLKGQIVLESKCTLDYNEKMASDDNSDKLLQYYPLRYKRFKWWKKLFFHLVNIAVVNAYILYKQARPKMKQYNFRLALVKELIKEGVVPFQCQRSSKQSNVPSILRFTGWHFPSKMPKGIRKMQPRKKCIVCSSRNVKQRSMYECRKCLVALCIDRPCFEIYHTKKNYALP